MLTILLVLLPFVLIICGVIVFNVYFRKQITRDTKPRPIIDEAYIEAENSKSEDEDLMNMS